MFRHILAALKFNSSGQKALSMAAELAGRHGAGLTVFHALDYHLQGDELARAEEDARTKFQAMAQKTPHLPRQTSFQCRAGEPAMVICRTARELGAGLIVLGCHQQDKCLSRVDYTGLTVLDKSPCPVLVVPTA